MKKFLFLLLSLAVVATASAGIDRSQLAKMSINPKVAKIKMMSDMKYGPMANLSMMRSDLNVLKKAEPTREDPTVITDNDVITMANESGYLMGLRRFGNAFVMDDNYDPEETEVDGYGYIYITADLTEAYVRNPVSGIVNWTKGTYDDETGKITMPLGQYLFYSSDNGYGVITAWATYADGSITVDESVTEYTYTMGSYDGALVVMLDNTSDYTGLAAIYSDDQSWVNCLDWNTIYVEEPSVPEELTVTPGSTTADVAWTNTNDPHWNLRYRPAVEGAPYVCGFDSEGDFDAWTLLDEDGDGNNWFFVDGSYWASSASYDNNTGILYPDNWMISPEVKLEGKLKFTYWGQDAKYAAEHFTVYVSTNFDGEDVSSFTAITEELIASGDKTEMEIDLSSYNGAMGRIAFRHHNVSDMFRLNIDDVLIGNPDFVFPEWTEVTALNDTAYTIEGLTPETNYEVQVQSYNFACESDWSASTYFTTLPEVPTVYIMGEVNEQAWAANAGTLMDYDSENKVYTATVNIDGRGENQENYFGFTYKLAENADDWDAIESYRFGAVSEGNFWINEDMYGTELSLTRENGQAFRILAGEYKFTVNTETMKLIVDKIGVEPQILLGDVNSDGYVTIADATLLIDYLLGANVTINEDNSDVETNGTISIGDVTALIDMLLNAN